MDIKQIEKEARQYGMVFTTQEELKKVVLEGLELAEKRLGHPYCPCKVLKVEDNICPCCELREQRKCTCGLFKRGTR